MEKTLGVVLNPPEADDYVVGGYNSCLDENP